MTCHLIPHTTTVQCIQYIVHFTTSVTLHYAISHNTLSHYTECVHTHVATVCVQ